MSLLVVCGILRPGGDGNGKGPGGAAAPVKTLKGQAGGRNRAAICG